MGSHDLLPDTAYRQHLAAQGDLAGHGNILSDRNPCQRRNEGYAHGHARGRTVLRRRALRNVQVQILVLIEVFINAELLRNGPDIADARLGGFLHHVTQLSGQDDLACAGNGCRFDEQRYAADDGPGQSRAYADFLLVSDDIEMIFLLAEQFLHLRGGQADLLCVSGHVLAGNSSAKRSDFPLQITYARLSGVVIDDGLDSSLRKADMVFCQAVLFDLLRHQILLGDLEFLFFGITADLDDFHSVQQRPWNRLRRVGSRDEHDL